jgi:hypothetical protein
MRIDKGEVTELSKNATGLSSNPLATRSTIYADHGLIFKVTDPLN